MTSLARQADDCELHNLPPAPKPPEDWLIGLVLAVLAAVVVWFWWRG